MAIEVEQKFRVSDLPALERALADLQGSARKVSVQVDCYFAHPSRDFARTDEALRLRRVGESNYITYKGPKLDATTKTRHEIEIALPDGQQSAAEAGELLVALGFARVAEVTKRRTHFTVPWGEWEIEISLDDVAGLGNFVELEIMATEEQMPAARDSLLSLARRLGLAGSERRSYLELLLAAQA